MRKFYLFLDQLRYLWNPFSRRLNIDVLLSQADPESHLSDKVLWLQDIVDWLRSPVGAEESATIKAKNRARIQTVRIRFLLHLLDRHPEWKSNFAAILRSVFKETSGLELFSLTGLTRERGFFSEATNRMMRKLLPSPADETDLAALFTRIFHDESDVRWVEDLSPAILKSLLDLIAFGDPEPEKLFEPLKRSMADALMILGPDVAAIGMSSDLRSRMSDAEVSSSPFRRLDRLLQELCDELRSGKPVDPLTSPLSNACEIEIRACREKIGDVYKHLEESGVSVALVFRLESLAASLSRVETLLRILLPHPSVDHINTGQRFLADLIRQSLDASGFRQLVRGNLDLLARKVVERVGLTGEHYITTTRSEYWQMLASGAGGGIVTVFTTILKFAISKAHMPLFFEGLFSWLNYSSSFLFMQAAHFSLATKQPSMTASALANKLRLLSHRRHLQEFVDEVARITRSQFAAALGNVGLVVPSALFFDLVFRQLTGKSVIDPVYALKTMKSLNPIESLTIPAAALTGVLLWLSAVTGGWIENWAVFRKIPEAIATNRRLQRVFGAERARRFSGQFSTHIAGVGSNLAIGFYLAFTPILGQFFGAPLDIRHVTLSSGSLAFAVSSIGWKSVDMHAFVWACIGIVIILALNFGVSFALALFVALRARRIKRAWVYHLVKAVGHRLRVKTRQFFFPPKVANESNRHS